VFGQGPGIPAADAVGHGSRVSSPGDQSLMVTNCAPNGVNKEQWRR